MLLHIDRGVALHWRPNIVLQYDSWSSTVGHNGVRTTVPVVLLRRIGMSSGCACAFTRHTDLRRQNCGIWGRLRERNADQKFHSTYHNCGIVIPRINPIQNPAYVIFHISTSPTLGRVYTKKIRSKYRSFPSAHHPIILGSILSWWWVCLYKQGEI